HGSPARFTSECLPSLRLLQPKFIPSRLLMLFDCLTELRSHSRRTTMNLKRACAQAFLNALRRLSIFTASLRRSMKPCLRVWSLESGVWSQKTKPFQLLTPDSRLQTPDFFCP